MAAPTSSGLGTRYRGGVLARRGDRTVKPAPAKTQEKWRGPVTSPCLAAGGGIDSGPAAFMARRLARPFASVEHRRKVMDIQGIYAAAYVSDLDQSAAWYGRLIGRAPDARPLPTMVQWRDSGSAGVQLFLDRSKAGASRMTIVTPAMDATRKTLAAAGIRLEHESTGDFGAIAQLADPDGNLVTLAEPPKGRA